MSWLANAALGFQLAKLPGSTLLTGRTDGVSTSAAANCARLAMRVEVRQSSRHKRLLEYLADRTGVAPMFAV